MKLIFKSLINNNACIDGGRKRKWWIAPILAILAIIFALVPAFVQSITVKGSQLFQASTYGMDYATRYFVEEAKSRNITMIVNEDKKLQVTNWDAGEQDPIEYRYNSGVDARFYYVEEYSLAEFRIFCVDKTATTVMFTSKDFYINLFNPSKDELVTSLTCTNAYNDYAAGTNIIDVLYDTNYDVSWNNTLNFLDKAFKYERVVEAWGSAGLLAGVFALVILLMGFMIWVLTRGKTNPFRLFTFFDGIKIACWAALGPGVLALPLGFLISRFNTVMFPMLFGIRAMWLAMKSLRPDGAGYEGTK